MSKIVLVSAAALLACSICVDSVSAHATPVFYDPPSAAILEAAPESVSIRFSERVEPGASTIVLYAPDGSRLDTEVATVSADDPRVLQTGFSSSGSGTYAVSWQVISADDGHFTKGGFVFSVGQASGNAGAGAGQFQIQHRSSWPVAILVALELLGGAILLACLTLIALWRKTCGDSALPLTWLRFLLILAAKLFLIGGLGYLLLESANLAFDQSTGFSVSLWTFLGTVTGRFTVYRVVLGIVASVLLLLHIRRDGSEDPSTRVVRFSMFPRRWDWILPMILVLIIALLRARVSHAAASTFLPAVSVVANAVHLLSKDFWIGGLLALMIAFLPALNHLKDTKRTAGFLLAFSNLLLLSLLIGGVSGTYIVWLHLKSPANLLTTHWGGSFIALGAYGLVLLLLRLYQQLLLLPAIVRGPEAKAREAAPALSFFLLVETCIALAVLLFSSLLISTTPPLGKRILFQQTVRTSVATVTFGQSPSEDGQFLVTVDRNAAPVVSSGSVMTVTLENTEKGIGPVVATLEERFPGGVVFPVSTLSPAGEWTVRVNQHEPEKFDAVASFIVSVPNDLQTAKAANTEHAVGPFEVALLVIAFAILLLCGFLLRLNRRLRPALIALHPPALAFAVPVPWLALCIGLIITVYLGISLHAHGDAELRKACALMSGTWHENVPMRDGVPASDAAALGCMLGMGQGTFHIIDPREFAAFTRRSNPVATLVSDPQTLTPGQPVTLSFRLRNESGQPLTGLTREHDRILHAVAVSQDLQNFQHLHVEDAGPVTPEMLASAVFPVRVTFPKAGTYLIGIDYTVRAQTFSETFTVAVGTPSPASPVTDPALTRTFDGLTAELIPPAQPLKAGVMQKLTYVLSEDGKPVTDLEPYLSAAMHLSVVRTDLKRFIHTHAELPQSWWDALFNPRDPNAKHVHLFLPDRFGPRLVTYVLFPLPGAYELFGEVNRGGKTVLTRFTVEVQ